MSEFDIQAQIRSYGKVYNLGHRITERLLDERCIVEEKVDGSQISFRVMADGFVDVKSKRVHGIQDDPPKLFEKAVETINDLFRAGKLMPGVTYRCEAITSPRHNTLKYDRTPKGYLVLFDVDNGEESYEDIHVRRDVATYLGIEAVPVLFEGRVTREVLDRLLDTDSFLGGPKIEGVVIKRAHEPIYDPAGKRISGKFVSTAFQEKHAGNPEYIKKTSRDVIGDIASALSTEARWEKMVNAMREDGVLTDSPRDIGPLLKRVQADIAEEEIDFIKQTLWKQFERRILSACARGIPQWYKERLAARVLDAQEEDTE